MSHALPHNDADGGLVGIECHTLYLTMMQIVLYCIALHALNALHGVECHTLYLNDADDELGGIECHMLFSK